MPLAPEKKNWLDNFTGIAITRKKFQAEKARKELITREVAAELERCKADIKTGLNVKLQGKGLLSRNQRLLVDKGTQMDEIDTEEANQTKGLTPEDHQKTNEAMRKIVGAMERMASATKVVKRPKLDDKGKPILNKKGKPMTEKVREPLYSDMEIAEEYAALVRERVIPENLVPDRYSKVQEMIDKTNELYMARLQEETDKQETENSNVGFAKMMISKTSNLAKSCAGMAGAEGEMAKNIITLVELGANTIVDVYDAVSKADIETGVGTAIDNIGAIMEGSLKIAFPDQGAAISQAGSAYKSITSVGKVVAALANPSGPNVEGALTALADGFSAGMDAFGQGSSLSQSQLTTIKEAVSGGFMMAAKADRIRKAIQAGDINAVIDEVTKAAQFGLGKGAAIAKSWTSTEQGKKIEDITKQIVDNMDLGALGVKTAVAVVDAARKKEAGLFATSLLDGMAGILSGVLKQAAPGVADRVGNGFTACTSPVRVAVFLYQDPPQIDKALQAIGTGLQQTMTTINPDDTTFTTVGTNLNTAFVAAGKGANIGKAIAEGKYEVALKQLMGVTKIITGKILGADLGGEDDEEGGDSEGGEGEELSTSAQNAKKALEGMEGVLTPVAGFLDALQDQKTQEKIAENVKNQQVEKALEELQDSRDEMQRALVLGEGEAGDIVAEAHKIEKLMKELMIKRTLLTMATKVVQGGIGLASKWVPGLEIAGSAVNLAVNVMKAADAAIEMHKWIQNHKDALKSQSPYMTSIQNFVKNQAELFSHYTIQAALDFVQMIGSICTVGGISAAAGQAIAKSAALAKAAEDLVYTAYKKADLEVAWVITSKALKNPRNRKLGLLARRQNPTLAKYTIAFGAVVKKDAIAKNSLAACGISEATLANPSINVDKVKSFLEMYFNEDNVVVKPLPAIPDWVPSSITLDIKSWAAIKARGIRVAFLADTDTKAIEVSLTRVNILVNKGSLEDDELDKLAKDLDALQNALKAYRPTFTTDKAAKERAGRPHDDMQGVVDRFLELAEDVEANLFKLSSVHIAPLFDQAEQERIDEELRKAEEEKKNKKKAG